MFRELVLVCFWTLAGVFGESVSVTEGDSVTLHTGLTELKYDDLIKWKFGAENTRIVKINGMTSRLDIYDSVIDGRFRDRLKVDHQTGSLTITDTTTQHAGYYKLEINGVSKSFSITVYARLPVPVIIRNSTQCSSYCSVLCSVVNVSAVSLSWYKGNSLLSSISASNPSISLSLPLEVEYQENNTYSCVINNTISNHTTHLDIKTLCQPCEGVYCCGSTEAVIRLIISAVVGVATVAFLVYDLRSTRRQDEKHISTVT